MPSSSSRSPDAARDAGLRLPRPPGVIRRFWARHPLLADVLIALACLLFSFGEISVSVAGGIVTDPATAQTVGIVGNALVVAGCAALLLRRRMPLLPFCLAIAVQLTAIAVPHSSAMALLTVSSYALAVYGSTLLCMRAGILGTVLVAALTAGATALVDIALIVPATLNATVSTAAALLFGGLVGVNVGNRRRWIAAVLERSRQLLVERDQQAELAAAAERERIAGEMHDVVSHSLTVIVALTEGAGATDDRERAREATDAAAATARRALNEMRAMLGVLRASDAAAPLAPLTPIPPAQTVADAQRAGFPVSLSTTGDDRVPQAVAHAVGRIVQEGVTNAIRHAPDATAVTVQIDYRADAVHVRIVNDGVRPATTPPGFGIQGLTERAARLGGTLHSAPVGAQWSLQAHLPMPGAADDRAQDHDEEDA